VAGALPAAEARAGFVSPPRHHGGPWRRFRSNALMGVPRGRKISGFRVGRMLSV